MYKFPGSSLFYIKGNKNEKILAKYKTTKIKNAPVLLFTGNISFSLFFLLERFYVWSWNFKGYNTIDYTTFFFVEFFVLSWFPNHNPIARLPVTCIQRPPLYSIVHPYKNYHISASFGTHQATLVYDWYLHTKLSMCMTWLQIYGDKDAKKNKFNMAIHIG